MKLLGFDFSHDQEKELDRSLPIFEWYFGSSIHNERLYIVEYRFAPYFFLHIGRHNFGLDWEWFPKLIPHASES